MESYDATALNEQIENYDRQIAQLTNSRQMLANDYAQLFGPVKVGDKICYRPERMYKQYGICEVQSIRSEYHPLQFIVGIKILEIVNGNPKDAGGHLTIPIRKDSTDWWKLGEQDPSEL